jgi:hypothetical protein
MSKTSRKAALVQEDSVGLHTLAGQCQNQTMLSTTEQLVNTIGLQDWRGWFEPFPGPRADGRFGRDTAFIPWTTQLPDENNTPPLAEIRIGGYLQGNGYGGCHLVRDGEDRIRWFAFAEKPFQVDRKNSTESHTVRRSYPVLQRADAKIRFFMQQHEPDWLKNAKKLQLAEYWQDERLFAWLVVDVKEQVQGGK